MFVSCFGNSGTSGKLAAQTRNNGIAAESDFTVSITDDNTSVITTRYKGDEKTVIIPEKIKGLPVIEVGGFSFNETVTNVVIPEGVTTISDSAFAHCKNLQSVSLPTTLTNIGKGTFYNSGLSIFPDPWPKALTTIDGGSATLIGIFGHTKLRNVVIPEGVTKISACTFLSCEQLTSVSLPTTIKEIGDAAFENCPALTTVNIPETVKSIKFSSLNWSGFISAFTGSTKMNLTSRTRLIQLGHPDIWW